MRPMMLVFVHGWSVTSTVTYGELPEALSAAAAGAGLELDVRHVFLGRYLSFHNQVTLDDLARAFDRALRRDLPNNANGLRRFSCVAHSTGAVVVRLWARRYHGAEGAKRPPLRHLIMLAPPNHGSALAQLGRERLGRLRAWFQGVEPGAKILDWLELGSLGQWQLNATGLADPEDSTGRSHRYFPFVLTGEAIDSRLYDHLNSYTGEAGSDGVVRVAAANLNCRLMQLRQTEEVVTVARRKAYRLGLVGDSVASSPPTAFGVLPRASHSGVRLGIMRSVRVSEAAVKPVVEEILRCLQVRRARLYEARRQELEALSAATQAADREREGLCRYCSMVFRLRDDEGHDVEDFDLLLLGGRSYHPDHLPKGFFKDRQRNRRSPNTLTYYLNWDCLEAIRDGKFGIKVTARPGSGFASYRPAAFRSEEIPLNRFLRPNQTLYVDIVLKRRVSGSLFRLSPATAGRGSFRGTRPSGPPVP